jgi:hypothetical protein
MKNYPENIVTPLELFNLYYSNGQSLGNKDNKLWQKMNYKNAINCSLIWVIEEYPRIHE